MFKGEDASSAVLAQFSINKDTEKKNLHLN